MLPFFLETAQIILSVLLIAAVLLQQKGVGLGGAFGGSSNIYSAKRGLDKMLFRATIVLSILFLADSLLAVLIV
ncbi:MAG TPA: preprotein translocase subunit SecG [Candidatus Magasanikbacteria bacterium]|nr:preprotein translocase subunit SecG [Candidatus Magasanikbacteria bacterium]